MSDPYHIPLGIEPLSDDPSKLLAHPSFDEMRAAINKGQRDSALIRSCLAQADYNGWSGEDRHVLLAYHALVMLEQLHKREMETLMKAPLPPLVTIPLDQLLAQTQWKEGPPIAPGSYVVEYEYRNANFEALNLIADSMLLQYPLHYNVKRHFRFYP